MARAAAHAGLSRPEIVKTLNVLKGKELRGRHQWALLTDIAAGALTPPELAEKHAVPVEDLPYYVRTYRDEIIHICNGTVDQYWTERLDRSVAELTEQVLRELANYEEQLRNPDLTPVERRRYERWKRQILHETAWVIGRQRVRGRQG